ncbi:uncharacterized protein LOC110391632 [Numida meleagris]|uniref:uncharacterized protein LOC110391632 n=1 Tax=Numida meleagris TaxID=8996 RepID=UPI000B3DECC2|nr:uncharacterized protein LOC110391632 [Numida meleagris]
MRQCRAAGLTAVLLAVAVSRAQVQQEPSAETSEGSAINITCSHPNIRSNEYIHWYRQLPGRGPAFLVSAVKDSKEVPDLTGQLWVSADRRSSALCLDRPRLGDAAVYYCAVDPRGGDPGLRPGTNRGGRAGRGHGPVRARRGRCRSSRRGRLASCSAPPELTLLTWNISLALLGILRCKAFQLHTFMSRAYRVHRHLQVASTVALFFH